ncbi:MAG: hypothetical protein EHM79_18695 [Geobacter sp.]|nr:MAG: hypothetical protein EHM79_18695 [Geobacter sp.]
MAWYKGYPARVRMSNNTTDFEIGDVLTYPCSDHKFYRICEIPEEVARFWLQGIDFRFHKDKLATYNASYDNNYWLNKMAIIVAVERFGGKVYAVYHHDGNFTLICKDCGY